MITYQFGSDDWLTLHASAVRAIRPTSKARAAYKELEQRFRAFEEYMLGKVPPWSEIAPLVERLNAGKALFDITDADHRQWLRDTRAAVDRTIAARQRAETGVLSRLWAWLMAPVGAGT